MKLDLSFWGMQLDHGQGTEKPVNQLRFDMVKNTSSNSNMKKTLHWQVALVAWCRCGVSFQDAAGVAGVQTAKPLGILCRECQVVLQGGRTCESACASIIGRRTSLEKMTVAHGGSLKSGKNATVYGAIACVVRPCARTDHASCVKSPFLKLLPF